MDTIEYKDVKQNGQLIISYPNHFDIESIRIYIEDGNGHHTTFLLDINTDFGKYLKNYFDPMPVDIKRELAKKHC